jgi:hypothetical protein
MEVRYYSDTYIGHTDYLILVEETMFRKLTAFPSSDKIMKPILLGPLLKLICILGR